jgi:hypothetical protein
MLQIQNYFWGKKRGQHFTWNSQSSCLSLPGLEAYRTTPTSEAFRMLLPCENPHMILMVNGGQKADTLRIFYKINFRLHKVYMKHFLSLGFRLGSHTQDTSLWIRKHSRNNRILKWFWSQAFEIKDHQPFELDEFNEVITVMNVAMHQKDNTWWLRGLVWWWWWWGL